MMPKYKAGDKVIINGHEVTIEYASIRRGFTPHYRINVLLNGTTMYRVDPPSNGLCWYYESELIPATSLIEDFHKNHEIIENTAYGKSFHYCRDCKVEV